MSLRTLTVSSLALLLLAGPASGQGQQDVAPSGVSTWVIDTSHSELGFRVRHLVSRVRGTFGEWSGTLQVDPDRLEQGSVSVVIRTASIDTRHDRRDNHLRSADFFDVENHPTMAFVSQRVERSGEGVRVHGTLTMRGVSRAVVLDGEFLGMTVDGQGRRRLGFEASTTINRHDFGVSWNNLVAGGGLVLGDEVTIQMAIAAIER
jgi:polyisoprenoid-binding protein YceI